jgi:hypothetical protein
MMKCKTCIENLDALTLIVKFYSFAVAAKEGRYDRDCYGRCGSVYGFSGPDFTSCLDECRIGGQKLLPDYKPATSNNLPAQPINSGISCFYN